MNEKVQKKLVFVGIDTDINMDEAHLIGDSLGKLNLPYNFIIVPSSVHLMSKEEVTKLIIELVNIAVSTVQDTSNNDINVTKKA
jgi:hypothetical protein